jgi:hypothetical protein
LPQRQLNIRLDETTFATLEAAAFVEGMSLPDIIRPELEALAAQLTDDQAVQTALRAREERQASRAGKLTPLRSRLAGRDEH